MAILWIRRCACELTIYRAPGSGRHDLDCAVLDLRALRKGVKAMTTKKEQEWVTIEPTGSDLWDLAESGYLLRTREGQQDEWSGVWVDGDGELLLTCGRSISHYPHRQWQYTVPVVQPEGESELISVYVTHCHDSTGLICYTAVTHYGFL